MFFSSPEPLPSHGRIPPINELYRYIYTCIFVHRLPNYNNYYFLQITRLTNALTEMEIRPHDLVPDTNCFIECLPDLEKMLQVLPHPQHPYVLMVPLVGE